MQRILIITDNPKNAGPWQQQLVRAGYPVQSSGSDRKELLAAFAPRPSEIFILDGTSVRMDPKELRELVALECPEHESCLIWLVTEEGASHLDPACGIDDFIILPSSAHELLARVIDQANYTVSVSSRTLSLTFKEYELLRFLVVHRGRVFTREALLNQVWGYDYYGGIRTVDVHIRRIRAKLGPEKEDLVETIRNVGYRFNA
jgi:DNA-binding response OmpR family regulator